MKQILFTVSALAGMLILAGCPTPNTPIPNTPTSDNPAEVTIPASPSAPILCGGDTILDVSWKAVGGAQSYEIWTSASDQYSSATRMAEGIEGTSHRLEGMENDKTSFVWLKAVNSAGTSEFSPSSAAFIHSVRAYSDSDTNPTNPISFNLRYCPGGTLDTGGLMGVVEVAPFWIGETEVTYELWHRVRRWAINNADPKYTFSSAGAEGNDGVYGSVPTEAKNEPVTHINWRDAMVWCNAATEWYNENKGPGANLTCVYTMDDQYNTPIRSVNHDSNTSSTQGSQDRPYVNPDADGFRLSDPSGKYEWPCAARYIDGTNWTPKDYASGAKANHEDSSACGLVAWYDANSGSATHEVKSILPNALGIYDMSGNVWEWSSAEYGNDEHLQFGGSWDYTAHYLQIGKLGHGLNYVADANTGFRIFQNN